MRGGTGHCEDMSQLSFDLQGPVTKKIPEPEVITVAVLTRRIRTLLETDVGELWVEGEVSNMRRQSSGHVYFTLKDAAAQLTCVLFAGQAAQLRGMNFADGVQVQVFGSISVYEPRGQYQMIVRKVRERGAGALQAKFEELKNRLAAEGLFDSARKRPLPKFPQRIGVVTSPTGAAIRDFLDVLHRRHRGIEVVIHPVRVQGRGAADEIARAVEELGRADFAGAVDVIVVTRGGGSLEDLWEFNEEVVARAIAASPVPVVSAVGHEVDFTIADFVADLRAATPSAAAELLSADREELMERIEALRARLVRPIATRLATLRDGIEALRRTALFLEPQRALRERQQTLDRCQEDLSHGIESALATRRRHLDRARSVLAARSPERPLTEALGQLDLLVARLSNACQKSTSDLRARLDRANAVLASLNPNAALSRGYTVTLDKSGKAIRKASELTRGDVLVTKFRDGTARSVVT